MVDTACPGQPEASDFIPEAPEGSPSPAGSLTMSAGASASSFPGEWRLEVPDFPGVTPAISSLIAQLDDFKEIAALQQRMLDSASYGQCTIRRSLRVLAVRGCGRRKTGPRMSGALGSTDMSHCFIIVPLPGRVAPSHPSSHLPTV